VIEGTAMDDSRRESEAILTAADVLVPVTLHGQKIFLEVAFIRDAIPCWNEIVSRLGRDAGLADIRETLDAACFAVDIPQKRLPAPHEMETIQPVGDLILFQLACLALSGVFDHPPE